VSFANDILAVTMTITRDAELHHLISGVTCLDFANTLYGHQDPIHEYLFDYRDLVLWSHHAGLLTSERMASMLAKSAQLPDECEEVFRRAIGLRETIFRIFASLAQGVFPTEMIFRICIKPGWIARHTPRWNAIPIPDVISELTTCDCP
jgi:hypothetical protein